MSRLTESYLTIEEIAESANQTVDEIRNNIRILLNLDIMREKKVMRDGVEVSLYAVNKAKKDDV